MSVYNLKSKKIIITGALGLIGSALSETLIKNKNKIILIDHNINKKDKSYKFFKKKKIVKFLI